MLNVRDRVTGDVVKITNSKSIHAGRYSLLKESSLGIQGDWSAGTVLMDDGRGYVEVDGVAFELEKIKIDTNKNIFLALEEIKAVANLTETERLPSPVISPKISRRLEPSQLQIELLADHRLGYLYSISNSPRISMKYDEELLAVSRVKRTANNYQRYLASHSACWYQRTFTGIVPKKLLAKISEDEVHIYENRIFARLLDHLRRYIICELIELRELNNSLLEGIELEENNSFDRRLRHALYEIWGDSFAKGEAESLKSSSELLLSNFEQVLSKIEQLRQSATYRAIPRNANVPLSLKNTNILTNDPHYIKMQNLWQLWVKHNPSISKDPTLTFTKRQGELECYSHYIGLLILRAHKKIGWSLTPVSDDLWVLKHPSGVTGKLKYESGEWLLLCDYEGFVGELIFVPLLYTLDSEKRNSNRILCSIHGEVGSSKIPNCSPMNLFTEESVIIVVQRWWLLLLVSDYGVEISKLPALVKEKWPHSHPSKKFIATGSLNYDDFTAWLNNFNLSNEVKASIKRSYIAAGVLSYCPCCGRQADKSSLLIRAERGFKSSCDRCDADWQIRSTGNSWIYEIGVDSDDAKEAGRWRQVIQL